MIKSQIKHVIENFNKKTTIQDYIQEPIINIKPTNVHNASYVARPVFNSIRKKKEKGHESSLCAYRRYKIKSNKSIVKGNISL